MGGTSRISQDYFNGGIDDLRFYQSALSGSDINATFNDDLSGAIPAGYSNQMLYDEGTSNSGIGVVLEGNTLKAKIGENGSFA